MRVSDDGVSLVCAQVLPEKAQEGEEEQWPDARHERGTTNPFSYCERGYAL